MKVLFVDHTGQPGGAELALGRYLERPSIFGRELMIFEDGALAKSAETAGIPCKVLGWSGRKKSFSLLVALLRAGWAVTRSDSSTVVANSLNAAILISRLPKRRKTFVYYLREDLSPEWLTGTKRRLVMRWVLPRFDAFLANSEWTASTLPSQLARKPMRVVYTMSGVRASATRRRTTNDTGTLRVLSLSRLVPWKGIHVLVQALSLLSKTDLRHKIVATVAGDDLFGDEKDYVEDLRESAAGLGEMISFVGHVENVEDLLATNDVLVSCSLKAEPFGQTVIQGMHSGLAVIATNQGGPKELLEDGRTGILIPPGDPVALAEAITSLARSPATVAAIGDLAISVARTYTDPPMAELLESGLGDLTKELGQRV